MKLQNGLTNSDASKILANRAMTCDDSIARQPICKICNKRLLKWEYLKSLACGHDFHGNCLNHIRNRKCPVCKQYFTAKHVVCSMARSTAIYARLGSRYLVIQKFNNSDEHYEYEGLELIKKLKEDRDAGKITFKIM
jgi:transcriptional regulator NrdR family protein